MHNLTQGQQKSLKHLQDNDDTTIKPADKGGNIVIMNKDHYKQMCMKILDNQKCYTKISPILINAYNEEFY